MPKLSDENLDDLPNPLIPIYPLDPHFHLCETIHWGCFIPQFGVFLPSFDDTKERIPEELQLRAAIENYLKQTVNSIPDEDFLIDEAIDRVSAP